MEACIKSEKQHAGQRLLQILLFWYNAVFLLFNRRCDTIVPQKTEEHGAI